ncbi:STAS domain-containing protein [Streptomyces violascens]|nr:STAS domain-containing protein [Streptomyces violascens]
MTGPPLSSEPAATTSGTLAIIVLASLAIFVFRRRRRRTNRAEGSRVVVRLRGEITATNEEETGRQLRAALYGRPEVLEIDLTDVSHLSGDGAAAFFTALKAARNSRTQLLVTHASPQARTMLTRMGLVRALRHDDGRGPGISQT